MMLVADKLRVSHVSTHVSLRQAIERVRPERILKVLQLTHAAVQRLGIARPKLAVAGLNPHAGEAGLIGSEEEEMIAPAIAELQREGVAVTGPHPADSLFHKEARAGYDAAIAMYHDQALIPLKTLAFDRGVNITLGLPFVRTSPDHGTAYALAGTGKARPDSLIAALQLAAELGERRRAARTTWRHLASAPSVTEQVLIT